MQVDGTVIIERTDENERFYGERIGVTDILAGKARHAPYEIKKLMETVKAAEGRTDVDQKMLDSLYGPAPADNELASPTTDIRIFGVPEEDDPDPFGVLALEKEGFGIREAGTKERPLSNQFEFHPSPTSPIYSKFHRRSVDTLASRSNRESYMSTRSNRTRNSIDRATQTEMGTQTDEMVSPITSPTNSLFEHKRIIEVEENERNFVAMPDEIDYTKIDLGPYSNFNNNSQDFDGTTAVSISPPALHEELHMAPDSTYVSDEDDFDDEEPVVFEAAEAQATVITPQALSMKGGLVNIPKRPPPPPLPPRSSARSSRVMVDQGSGKSPIKDSFEEVEVHGVGRTSEEKRRSHLSGKPISASDLGAEERFAPVPESPKGLGITMHDAESNEAVTLEKKTQEKADVVDEKESRFAMLMPESEDDTFHSLPTTPMETVETVKAVEVK